MLIILHVHNTRVSNNRVSFPEHQHDKGIPIFDRSDNTGHSPIFETRTRKQDNQVRRPKHQRGFYL